MFQNLLKLIKPYRLYLIVLAAGAGIFGLAAGLATGNWLLALGVFVLFPPSLFILSLLIAAAVTLPVIVPLALHELGHLAFGKLVGWKLFVFRVGPFFWVKSVNRMRFAFRGSIFESFLGFVVMVPNHEQFKKRDYALLLFGGMLASVTFLLPMLWLCKVCNVGVVPELESLTSLQAWDYRFILWVETMMFAVVCASSWIPYRDHGLYSDALQLLLLPSKRFGRLVALSTMMNSIIQSGARALDWDDNVLRENEQLQRTNEGRAGIGLYRYYHAFDSGKGEEALELIERTLSIAVSLKKHHHPSFQGLVQLEAAFARARLGSSIEKAEALLDCVKETKPLALIRLRVKAAIEARKGNHAEAARLANEALEVIGKRYPDPLPNVQAEIEWLGAIVQDPRNSQSGDSG